MNRLRALLAAVLLVVATFAVGAGVASAQTVPARPIATADACAVLSAEGVGKLRADVLAELGVPEIVSNATIASLARDKLGCTGPVESGTALDAKICANLDLDGIRSLVTAAGAPGIAENIQQAQLDKVAVRLNCAAVVPTPSPTVPAPAPPVRFETCADADAAGRSPILVSDPAYRIELDIDGDGIACERQEGVTGSSVPANDQVRVMPSGGVDTGDGTTAR